MRTRNTHRQRGVALIMAIFMTVIGSVLLGVAAQMFLPDSDFVSRARNQAEAMAAAEAGMSQAEAFLYSAFYQRLGSPEGTAAAPLPNNAPRTLGDSIRDPISGAPINGPDNHFNGVFAELDRYFQWPNASQSNYLLYNWTPQGPFGSPLDTQQRAVARGVVWPSTPVTPGQLAQRNLTAFKVMMTESPTTTTNNPDDLAVDTYSREVIIRSVGVVLSPKQKGDGTKEQVPDIVKSENTTNIGVTRDRVNVKYAYFMKKKIVFQVKRRRGWAGTFVNVPAAIAACQNQGNPPSCNAGGSGPIAQLSPPPGWRLVKASATLPVYDTTIFNPGDPFLYSRHNFDPNAAAPNPNVNVDFEKHFISKTWDPLNAAGSIQISPQTDGLGDTGAINYNYDFVDAPGGPPPRGGMPLLMDVSRASLAALPAQEFVRSVKYYLLGNPQTSQSEINILAAPAADPNGNSGCNPAPNNNTTPCGPGFLTQDTGGNNDYTRMNAFIQYVSNGSSGIPMVNPATGSTITDFTNPNSGDLNYLRSMQLLPRQTGGTNPYESQAYTLYQQWQTTFVTTNYRTNGTYREIPTSDTLIDTTYTDYTIRNRFPGFPATGTTAASDPLRNPCNPGYVRGTKSGLNSNKTYVLSYYPLVVTDDPPPRSFKANSGFDLNNNVQPFDYGPGGTGVVCNPVVPSTQIGTYLDKDYFDWVLEGETP